MTYYSKNSLTPRTTARAEEVNQQLAAIESAFNKLPAEAELKQARATYAGADTGAADAYVVSLPYAPSAYTAGLTFAFKPANANTGASTINVDGLGAKAIKRANGDALKAGDLVADAVAVLAYDGADFRLISPNQADVNAAAASASAAATSKTNAATSASNAASSASAAASSASDASDSADLAAAAAGSAGVAVTYFFGQL